MARGDAKNICLGNEVREKILAGAKITHDVAAAAYGPVSGNVALEKSYGNVVVSHDGVTNVKEVVLQDKVMDIGADLLKQASTKSADTAGDGSTATVLLGYYIMERANKLIAAGYNPMKLRRGIDAASLDIKQQIEAVATPVPEAQLAAVASISASDPELGKLVADTVVRVGGVGITIEEYDGLGVIQDVVEGLYFEKGWTMPHFVTDRENEEAILDNTSVLILEKRISAQQDIIPMLEMVYEQTEHKTVLVLGNVTNKALEVCALTNVGGKVKICVVAPPVYGDQVLPFLEDVAVMTGGKVVPASLPADKVDVSYLGAASKVVVQRSNTTVIGGDADTSAVADRIKVLKKQLTSDKYSAFQRERMEKRLSKLQGKLGIIKVGGATEAARKELKFRIEDAVHATRAAKEEGIVPGGATTLARIAVNPLTKEAGDESTRQGYQVVYDSLADLFRRLMLNAGEDPGYRLQQVQRGTAGQGFDVRAMTEEPVDLLNAGIIDPAKVIKSIVENACDVAGIAITLNAAVTIDRDYQLQQAAYNQANAR